MAGSQMLGQCRDGKLKHRLPYPSSSAVQCARFSVVCRSQIGREGEVVGATIAVVPPHRKGCGDLVEKARAELEVPTPSNAAATWAPTRRRASSCARCRRFRRAQFVRSCRVRSPSASPISTRERLAHRPFDSCVPASVPPHANPQYESTAHCDSFEARWLARGCRTGLRASARLCSQSFNGASPVTSDRRVGPGADSVATSTARG